jgi:hypothetical protein
LTGLKTPLVKKNCAAEGIMQMNALSILNANRKRPLSAGQSGTASARSWDPNLTPAAGMFLIEKFLGTV